MSASIQQLIRAYQVFHADDPIRQPHPFLPTAQSIQRINATLAMELPASMIAFVSECGGCPDWFASLGENYASPGHILRIASHTRRIRRRVPGGKGRHAYARPKAFIPFTGGHDNDHDCMDTAARNPLDGEYVIQYWSPSLHADEIDSITKYASFPAYIEARFRFRVEQKVSARDRERARTLKERVLALLDNRL